MPADRTITITVPGAHVQEVSDAVQHSEPIPMLEDGVTPEFTEAEWVQETLRRHLIGRVKIRRRYLATQAATTPVDDDFVT